MTKFYATISIENSSLEEASEVLNKISGFDCFSQRFFCIGFELDNRTEALHLAQEFLKKHGLADEYIVPDDIDLQRFGVQIDIYTMIDDFGYQIIDVFSDKLCLEISKILGKKTILNLNLDEVSSPLFIYDKGVKIYDFKELYNSFFKHRNWCPVY